MYRYSYSSDPDLAKFYRHIDKLSIDSEDDDWLKAFTDFNKTVKVKAYNHKEEKNEVIEYYNVPASLDIETNSFYQTYCPDGNLKHIVTCKMACQVINQFGVDGKCVYHRTWEEFKQMLDIISQKLHLNHNRRLVVFVHNLSYEFGFIKHLFEWDTIFARKANAPIKAVTKSGIEFRCSYTLSGLSLDTTAKNLLKYKVKKKTGDWDYDLSRSPITPLSKQEIGYAIFDIICVMNYIQEQIEMYGDITKIPLTNTGRSRRHCREICFSEQYAKNFRITMSKLTLDGSLEYSFLMKAFTAGYTHANYLRAGDVEENVFSFDFCSSYPACFFDKFPMSKGQWIKIENIEWIENMMKDYYLIFDIELNNIQRKEGVGDSYLSVHKCDSLKNVKVDNGRIIAADKLQTTITSDDWWIIKRAYDIKGKITVGRCIRYRMDYLPKPLLQCVIDLYEKKTSLKGVPGMEQEAQNAKGLLNALYGMILTKVDEPEQVFENGMWREIPRDLDDVVDKLNKDKNRFIFTPWGLRICSNARRRLWSGIFELGMDLCYEDTDSLKFVHYERHKEYFELYNKTVSELIEKVCKARGLDVEGTRPKTIKGKIKPLGIWENESEPCEPYQDRYGNTITEIYARRFKCLGAKRYIVEHWNEDEQKWEIKATIAGANKKGASEFIANNPKGVDPFEFFSNNMVIDEDHSGRLIHSYSPEGQGPFYYKVTDYLGNEYEGVEQSFIHLSKSDYSMSLADAYAALLCEREIQMDL